MSKKSLDEQSNMEMGNCGNNSNGRPPRHNSIHQLTRLSAKVQPIDPDREGCDEDTAERR